MSRPSWDRMFLDMAAIVARRSTCPRRPAGVGAVLVESTTHHVLGVGYAGSAPGAPHCADVGCLTGPDGGCLRTTHAEQNCVVHARGGAFPQTLYTTLSPCVMCLKLGIAAGVRRFVFAEKYRIFEAVQQLATDCCVTLEHLE